MLYIIFLGAALCRQNESCLQNASENAAQKGREQSCLKITGLHIETQWFEVISAYKTSRSSVLIITCTLYRVQIPTPVSGLVWTYISLISMTAAFGAVWSLTLLDIQTYRLLLLLLLHTTGALHVLHWALSTRLVHQWQRQVCWGCMCTQRFPFSEFQSLLNCSLC